MDGLRQVKKRNEMKSASNVITFCSFETKAPKTPWKELELPLAT